MSQTQDWGLTILYLLDANVLINANRDYYPVGQVDEYWDWLVVQGQRNVIKIPFEIFGEFNDGSDALTEWAKQKETEEALMFDEEVDNTLVQKITYDGYIAKPTDVQLKKIGRDPILMAYAMQDKVGRAVVTTEVSKPSRQAHNRHMPDVCKDYDINCITAFQLTGKLGFTTDRSRW